MSPSDELATRIVELDPARRSALVDRLYRERGWRVTETDAADGWVGRHVVSPDGRQRRLLVAAVSDTVPPEAATVDLLVRPGDVRPDDTDGAVAFGGVVGAGALAEQIRYALTPDAQRRLAETVFDTDRATMLDLPERHREPPDATPTAVGASDTAHTPVANTDEGSTATGSDTTTESETDRETGTSTARRGDKTKREAAPTEGGPTGSPGRRAVAVGALLVGVIVVAFAAGGSLAGVDGGPLSGAGGADTASALPFDADEATASRGVSGVTPTPGNVAPGPAGESTDGQTGATTDNGGPEGPSTPVSGTTPTPADDGVPGVTVDGAVDERVLAERTAAVLVNRSYRFVVAYRERVNGTTTARFREVAHVENESSYVSRISRLGEPLGSPQVIADTAVSVRDGRVIRRAVGDGVVRRERHSAGDPFQPRVAQYVEWYLGVESSAVVDRERREGGQRLLLRLRGDPWPGVENATGSAVVTDTGLVRSVTRRYTLPGRPNVTATVTVRITDVGATTVDGEALTTTSETREPTASRPARATPRAHHSTRYVHRSPPSARQLSPTSVASA